MSDFKFSPPAIVYLRNAESVPYQARRADPTEVLVTAQMRVAGASVLADLRDVLASEELSEAIYTAMAAASPAKAKAKKKPATS